VDVINSLNDSKRGFLKPGFMKGCKRKKPEPGHRTSTSVGRKSGKKKSCTGDPAKVMCQIMDGTFLTYSTGGDGSYPDQIAVVVQRFKDGDESIGGWLGLKYVEDESKGNEKYVQAYVALYNKNTAEGIREVLDGSSWDTRGQATETVVFVCPFDLQKGFLVTPDGQEVDLSLVFNSFTGTGLHSTLRSAFVDGMDLEKQAHWDFLKLIYKAESASAFVAQERKHPVMNEVALKYALKHRSDASMVKLLLPKTTYLQLVQSKCWSLSLRNLGIR